jgi:hypothetical protein
MLRLATGSPKPSRSGGRRLRSSCGITYTSPRCIPKKSLSLKKILDCAVLPGDIATAGPFGGIVHLDWDQFMCIPEDVTIGEEAGS